MVLFICRSCPGQSVLGPARPLRTAWRPTSAPSGDGASGPRSTGRTGPARNVEKLWRWVHSTCAAINKFCLSLVSSGFDHELKASKTRHQMAYLQDNVCANYLPLGAREKKFNRRLWSRRVYPAPKKENFPQTF